MRTSGGSDQLPDDGAPSSRRVFRRRREGDVRASSRGLVAAIDIALDMLALFPGAAPVCGQMIVCGLAGPPNYGPGALPPPPGEAAAAAAAGEGSGEGSGAGSGAAAMPPRTPAR